MKAADIILGFIVVTAGLPQLNALELQAQTIKAWDEYIALADSNMQMRLDGQLPFLWADEAVSRISQLQRGKTVVAPFAGNGIVSVQGGLIHHWIGAVFIPHSTLAALHSVFSDYDRYKDFYKPVVADSRALPCANSDQRFSMIWQHRVLFVNAAIEGEYRAHDFAVDARRGYNIATTTEVREIEGYGKSDERLLAPGEGNGFIWRMHSIARFEERDGGVYLELEAIALTRDIPGSLRWLVSPVVNHLSFNSLTTTLCETRDAVHSISSRPQTLALRPAGRSGNGRPGTER